MKSLKLMAVVMCIIAACTWVVAAPENEFTGLAFIAAFVLLQCVYGKKLYQVWYKNFCIR